MRAILLLPLLAAACAATPPSEPPAPASSGRCEAEAAQGLAGQPGTEANAQEAQRLSGARAVRWIRPGMAVTMDYREDRLNIELDAQERISAIRCG